MPQKTTQHGTFLYAGGRERKRRILVDPQASDDELEKSLRLARERFGARLFVSGRPALACAWLIVRPKGSSRWRFLTGSWKRTGRASCAARWKAGGGLGGGKRTGREQIGLSLIHI